jgi:hypothetical protein
MKHGHLIAVMVALAMASGCDTTAPKVIVKRANAPLPAELTVVSEEQEEWGGSDNRLNKFVNQQTDNKWEKYHDIAGSFGSSAGWQTNYQRYSRALVDRAVAEQLDSQSLSNVLVVILARAERHGMAYLPFAAYFTTFDGKPAWSIDVKWEFEGHDQLGHIRTYAFTAQDIKEIGFTTCR